MKLSAKSHESWHLQLAYCSTVACNWANSDGQTEKPAQSDLSKWDCLKKCLSLCHFMPPLSWCRDCSWWPGKWGSSLSRTWPSERLMMRIDIAGTSHRFCIGGFPMILLVVSHIQDLYPPWSSTSPPWTTSSVHSPGWEPASWRVQPSPEPMGPTDPFFFNPHPQC